MRRTQEGRYVKADDYLAARGEVIQVKQEAFEVIKQNVAANETIKNLMQELKEKENEILFLRGKADGLGAAVKVLGEAKGGTS
jgi:hypothetical protein